MDLPASQTMSDVSQRCISSCVKKTIETSSQKKIPLRQTSYHQFSPKQKLSTGPPKRNILTGKEKMKILLISKASMNFETHNFRINTIHFPTAKKKKLRNCRLAVPCQAPPRNLPQKKSSPCLAASQEFFCFKKWGCLLFHEKLKLFQSAKQVTKLVFKTSPQKAKKSLNTFINKLDTS